MNEFTPVQKKMLQTWTEERDTILGEIRIHTEELNQVNKSLKEGGIALSDLDRQIAERKGRLAEMEALETRYKTSVSIEVSELEVRKSRLEAECIDRESRLKVFDERKTEKVEMIQILSLVHDKMGDQAKIVDQVVGQVIEVSRLATSDMKVAMTEIKALSDQVIDRGNENLSQTKIVLEKLPKYIFELQRPIPIRRAYTVPHGTRILPEPNSSDEMTTS